MSDTYNQAMRQTRHYKLATKMLRKASKLLLVAGYIVRRDGYRHIVVPFHDGTFVSIYCGGFSPYYAVQKLTKSGNPDRRCTERSYATARGVFNYVNKLSGKLQWDY